MLGVLEQAGRPDLEQAFPVVDFMLARAAGDPLEGAELELAGGVVAPMADDTSALEDGQDIAAEGELGLGRG